MSTVIISPEVRKMFPEFGVLLVSIRGVGRLAAGTAAERVIHAGDVAALREVLDWRGAYRAFGLKPSDHRSSIEALLRRPHVRTGIPFVDYYNSLSINHRATMGAYDAEKVGQITVRPARPGDSFSPIGGGVVAVKPGVLCYCDGTEVICYGLNYRDSSVTAVSAVSDEVLVISEYVSQSTRNASVAAIKQLLADCAEIGVESSLLVDGG